MYRLKLGPVAAKYLDGADPKKTLAPDRTERTWVIVGITIAAIFAAGLAVGWALQG